jgi:hypothetical protein
MRKFLVAASVVTVSALLAPPSTGAPIMNANTVEYQVKNETGMDAQDLELDFAQTGIRQGASKSFGSTTIPAPPNDDNITFTGGTVKNNNPDSGSVTFKPKSGPFELANAFWTFSAMGVQPIQINLAKVGLQGGKKLSMASPTGLEGYASLINDDSSTIYISNLQLAINIPEADYDPASSSFEDDLDIPDGTAVTGTLASFSLAPGQEMDFDLGPVDATDFEAFQFNVSFSPTSSDVTLGFASDVVVPEPSTLVLFGTGLLFLIRRRVTAHS